MSQFTASKKLCADLWELSRWYDTEYTFSDYGEEPRPLNPNFDGAYRGELPAYTVGYLLRKLPPYLESLGLPRSPTLQISKRKAAYVASYSGSDLKQRAETPEDAICMLAIQLWRDRSYIFRQFD